jgi:gas vesicle protein
MSENTGSRSGGLLAAFAVGAAIGAGVALLYAPQSGKHTRGMIADKGRQLRGKTNGALENGKGYIRDRRSDLAAAVEGGKEAMREERAKHQAAV